MSLRLALCERWLPDVVRRRTLDDLTAIVAEAFGCPMPQWRRLSFAGRLDEFAQLTAAQAAKLDQETQAAGPGAQAGPPGDESHVAAKRRAAVMSSLYTGAEMLGTRLRHRLGVQSHDEALRALVLLYRQLEIDVRPHVAAGTAPGERQGCEIEVARCFFSGVYSPAVCGVMSAVDQGVVAGLTAGDRLQFRERLTEGSPACRADLLPGASRHEPAIGSSGRRAGGAPTAIVVGSGAGGATAARELARAGFRVAVLEAGGEFTAFGADLQRLAALRSTRLFLDERMITALFPPMRVAMGADHMPLVYGRATGGTTTLTAGNGLRVDDVVSDAGVDLASEYGELSRSLPIAADHQSRWRESTRDLFASCARLGLEPKPMPKLVDLARCKRCGRCVLGCQNGAKWDSRRFLDDAKTHGAAVVVHAAVERLSLEDGHADGVIVRRRGRRELIRGDLVVLAAGGFGTPAILERSGIATERRLAVDPVLCVSGHRPGAAQHAEMPMAFFAEREGYVISPYFDYLSFFFDRRWHGPAGDILPLMIKLADSPFGNVTGRRIHKGLTTSDQERLREAVDLCRRILLETGVEAGDIFLGTVNAGHPGGTLPLTEATAESLHDPRLPANVYVADGSLFTHALGKPPSLAIMAIALRVARACAARFA